MEKLNKIFKTCEIPVIDKYTIEHEPVNSMDLMERAAIVWINFFLKIFGKYCRVAILPGNGNNGGDGYAIARLMMQKQIEVVVFRVMTGVAMSPECEVNYRRWLAMGGKVKEVLVVGDLQIEEGDVLVDAIFGSGLNRKVTGLVREIIQKINAAENKVVSVDIPSGLMGEDNSLNDSESVVRADYTFTFQFPKLAFMLAENACYVGKWSVLDIGLHPDIITRTETRLYYTTADTIRKVLPEPEVFAHKGMNGKGLLIAGSYSMMGAAILAAKAAVRSGVGLLYCHTPVRGSDLMQISVPEALLEIDKSQVCFSDVNDLSKYDAVAIGPAIGQGPETVVGLRKLLQNWKGKTILDADALNLLAEHRDLLGLLHRQCILTPHVKEFERLAGKSENDFERLNKLSTFANQYDIYIVLKGAHSVVAAPDGRLFFNMSGNPGMAKGGSGDVLTGVLLGLAANGMDMLDVALAGVYAHGLSGDIAATENGYRGISAGMIADGMGKAWRSLEVFRNIEEEV